MLIKKNRPKWQAGRLNGVGGHIEAGEAPIVAMVREYQEETGVESTAKDWLCFACLRGPEFKLYFFSAFNDALLEVKTTTDEKVAVYPSCLSEIHPSSYVDYHNILIPNLNWLIPLALDSRREGFKLFTDAEYFQ